MLISKLFTLFVKKKRFHRRPRSDGIPVGRRKERKEKKNHKMKIFNHRIEFTEFVELWTGLMERIA